MVWASTVILLLFYFHISEIIAFARYLPVTPALPVTSETCPLPLDYSKFRMVYYVIYGVLWCIMSYKTCLGIIILPPELQKWPEMWIFEKKKITVLD